MSSFTHQYAPSIGLLEAEACYSYLLKGGWLTEFKRVSEFEDRISNFIGSRYCIVTTSGTVALALSLMALGVGLGDEVLVPNLTMIATPNAVRLLGGEVILVDVEPETLCMDVQSIKKSITKKTKALIYVSLNGRGGKIEEVKKICNAYNISLIEDAAQSFGSCHNGFHLGRYGEMGIFSFSMPKIITTGQGGAIVFDDEKYLKKIRQLKNFGREKGGHDIHDEIGYNFKFTDIQAVVGMAQLETISERVNRKRELYSFYRDELSFVSEIQFLPTNLEEITPWFVDVFIENREDLIAYLNENAIGSRPIYPPINSQKIYKLQGDFDISSNFSRRGLWLPSSMDISNSQLEKICDIIKSFFKKGKRL